MTIHAMPLNHLHSIWWWSCNHQ